MLGFATIQVVGDATVNYFPALFQLVFIGVSFSHVICTLFLELFCFVFNHSEFKLRNIALSFMNRYQSVDLTG